MDVVLSERWPAWRAREALIGAMLPGWSLWTSRTSGWARRRWRRRVCAADYRIVLGGRRGCARRCADAADARARARRSLFRNRDKGGGERPLRPAPAARVDRGGRRGPPVVLRVRTRFDPQLGNGRPEEVVAALADDSGTTSSIDDDRPRAPDPGRVTS